mgnify:FL=1
MAHFAELDENNTVLRIVVVSNAELIDENGDEQELLGISFCQNLFGGIWKQTSYTGLAQGRYAAVGGVYDPILGEFLPPS